ncbi:MAG: M55 family metallopeptidase [Sphaerochaeta sp.]|uniref:M55 family metallopeptidase n=1 Tax=Sphaerochaeta sp. TaxID=1972642 RepID=UPI003D0D32AB
MKVFISTDMEGIEGISSWNEMTTKEGWCASQLKQELSYVIDALTEQADVEEICICDSHSRGENLVYGSFGHPEVTHIKGYPRHSYMMEGLDASFDAVFLLGYHASIGSLRGGMDHSYSSSCIYEIRLNGQAVGEVEINAYYAGLFNVPVCLVSGDDVLQSQLESFLPVPYVRTKEGLARYAAKMYSPEKVKQSFAEQVQAFLDRRGTFEAKKLEGPITLEVDVTTTVIADAVAIVPGLERIAGRTVRYCSESYDDVFHMILTIAMFGGRFAQYT